jgi:cold shock protein
LFAVHLTAKTLNFAVFLLRQLRELLFLEEGGTAMAAIKGTVKWFNESKGFGFIATEDSGDVFVHYSEIEGESHKSLVEGEEVMLEVIDSAKGPKATHVVKAERSAA